MYGAGAGQRACASHPRGGVKEPAALWSVVLCRGIVVVVSVFNLRVVVFCCDVIVFMLCSVGVMCYVSCYVVTVVCLCSAVFYFKCAALSA